VSTTCDQTQRFHHPPPQHYSKQSKKVQLITKRETYRSQVIEVSVLSRIPPKIMTPIIWASTAGGIVTAATVHILMLVKFRQRFSAV
jgi:hypothetical protein